MARNHEPGMPAKKGGTSGNGGIRSKYRASGGGGKVRWDFADPTLLLEALVAATEDGAALLFAKSRDGGVLVCTLFDGDERIKYYWGDEFEVAAGLTGIKDAAKSG